MPKRKEAQTPTLNVARLKGQLRKAIIYKYARLNKNGKTPQKCAPSPLERAGAVPRRETKGTDWKIIYPDETNALAAAWELSTLDGVPYRAYACRRSEHGHYHVTTRP